MELSICGIRTTAEVLTTVGFTADIVARVEVPVGYVKDIDRLPCGELTLVMTLGPDYQPEGVGTTLADSGFGLKYRSSLISIVGGASQTSKK